MKHLRGLYKMLLRVLKLHIKYTNCVMNIFSAVYIYIYLLKTEPVGMEGRSVAVNGKFLVSEAIWVC